jgi:DNA-binding CsgD family transcriptional regulator/PAS domain-containing protein
MTDAISPQALSNLIGSIYDRALDPSGWDQTLSDVPNAFDSNHLNLSLIDLWSDRFLLLKNVGLSPQETESACDVELGKLLLPHLRRAQAISKVLDVCTIAGAQMAEALDALRCAVMLTNEQGTILHANRAAEHMLHEGSPIQSANGILQATAPSAAFELRSALALAARNDAGVGKTGLTIRLTGLDGSCIFAHVLPLAGSDFRTRLRPGAVAAVFIGAPPDAQDGADAAAATFGLTQAETRVLASLFAGHTLAETAANLGIAGTTAKTHLEHIFLKTGVTRQAELMRLWSGLISPTASDI